MKKKWGEAQVYKEYTMDTKEEKIRKKTKNKLSKKVKRLDSILKEGKWARCHLISVPISCEVELSNILCLQSYAYTSLQIVHIKQEGIGSQKIKNNKTPFPQVVNC